jgi:hypothetical protein
MAAATARLSKIEVAHGIELLQDRLAVTQAEIVEWEEPPSLEVSSLMARLSALIEQSHQNLNGSD